MTEDILLVEDDEELADAITEYLSQQGFHMRRCAVGEEAVHQIRMKPPRMVILDLMLPGSLDGHGVCRAVRGHYRGPILMLTAIDDDFDEVAALELGADDYVRKPVKPRVLLARVRSHLRRETKATADDKETRVGDLVLYHTSRRALLGERELDLSTAEFELLAFLARHAGTVVSRDVLYSSLRGTKYDGIDRSLDVRVSRLRRAIGNRGDQFIKTIRGTGYLLAKEPEH
ncbi:MAG: response regulator transcription factor [Myxococcota bacterium]